MGTRLVFMALVSGIGDKDRLAAIPRENVQVLRHDLPYAWSVKP